MVVHFFVEMKHIIHFKGDHNKVDEVGNGLNGCAVVSIENINMRTMLVLVMM
jgi:hypothetical protein